MRRNTDDGGDMPYMPPEDLIEHLIDAIDAGRFETELVSARQMVDRSEPFHDPDERFRYRLIFYNLVFLAPTDERLKVITGVDLLGAVTGENWVELLETPRIDELRGFATDPEYGIELLELLTYAPDDGIRDFACAQLESTGLSLLAAGGDTRSVERLLHAAGARDAAYRLEGARKQRAGLAMAMESSRAAQGDPVLPFDVVAIAGGHAQLRKSAAVVLERYGVTVAPIPSSQEAVRRERDMLQALRGADLAMLLVRQITHSTSDQLRKVAERLGVPVMYSNAASAVAIERQLLERAKEV